MRPKLVALLPMLVACKPVPSEIEPPQDAPAPATDESAPEVSAPTDSTRWPGYDDEVLAQFEHARAVLGQSLEGWTLGTYAPALYAWVPQGSEIEAWMGTGCERIVLYRPGEYEDDEYDTGTLVDGAVSELGLELHGLVSLKEYEENGVRVREFESATFGHLAEWGNGSGTQEWRDGTWFEASGTGYGEPPRIMGVLSFADERVARYEATHSYPTVACTTPVQYECKGGGSRLCPSCTEIHVETASYAGDGGVGFTGSGGQPCTEPCPPPGPINPELKPLSELLRRYGAFRPAREGEATLVVYRDQAECLAAARSPGD